MSSTPISTDGLKGLKTSDITGQLYDTFVGCETARYPQIGLPESHREFDTINGNALPVEQTEEAFTSSVIANVRRHSCCEPACCESESVGNQQH